MNSRNFFIRDQKEKMKGTCFRSISIRRAPFPKRKFCRLLLTLQLTNIQGLNLLVRRVFLWRLLSRSTTVFNSSSSDSLFLKGTSCLPFTCPLLRSISFWILVSAVRTLFSITLCHSAGAKRLKPLNSSSSMPSSLIFIPSKNMGSCVPAKAFRMQSEEMRSLTKMSRRSSNRTASSPTMARRVRFRSLKRGSLKRARAVGLVMSCFMSRRNSLVNSSIISWERNLFSSYSISSSSSISAIRFWFYFIRSLVISSCLIDPARMNSLRKQQIDSSFANFSESCPSPRAIQCETSFAKSWRLRQLSGPLREAMSLRRISMDQLERWLSRRPQISTQLTENWRSKASSNRDDYIFYNLPLIARYFADKFNSLPACPFFRRERIIIGNYVVENTMFLIDSFCSSPRISMQQLKNCQVSMWLSTNRERQQFLAP